MFDLFDDPELDDDPSEEFLLMEELFDSEREVDSLLRHRPSLSEWEDFDDDDM